MADYTFPTLSKGISFENFSDMYEPDPTYRSEMDDGTVITRARFTALKNKFGFNYRFLTAADKALLQTMQGVVYVGAGVIAWTNPSDSVAYRVRLTKSIQYRIEPNDHTLHSAVLEFLQV